jgi:hypothetical protein
VGGGRAAFIAEQPRSRRATGAANCGSAQQFPPIGRGAGARRWPRRSTPEARPQQNVGATSPNSSALWSACVAEAVPILGCLLRPRGSGAGQRSRSRRVPVRYRESVSGKRKAGSFGEAQFTGGRVVSSFDRLCHGRPPRHGPAGGCLLSSSAPMNRLLTGRMRTIYSCKGHQAVTSPGLR